MIDLAGIWNLRDVAGEFSCSLTLPGDCLSALIDAEVLPDPYYGRNEYDCRWPAERDWIASRSFEASGDGPWLFRVDGLDTVAEVRLNGKLVLEAANSFRPHTADVSEWIREGSNEIEILFKSNPKAGQEIAAAQPYPVPHTHNNPVGGGNMLRKVQCDFGWDWGPCLMPFGVSGTIAVHGDVATDILSIEVEQKQIDGEIYLEVCTLFAEMKDAKVPYRLYIDGAEVDRETINTRADAFDGQSCFISDPELACAKIENPKFWWPAGHGAQHLYEIKVELGDQSKTIKVALRDINLITDQDETGSRFAFEVNGREIFAKGANWIPADALPSRITPEKTRALLQSAVDANMNMIRVWGGGRYEPDWFYEICDELGLLVWQDFMFSCNLYPADEDFLEEVAEEVCYQSARLSHRVAVWCGDNELVGALTWYDESIKNRDRYLVAYDRLNRTIETSLKNVSPGANWWPSSPCPGHMDFGDAWHDDSKGDMHFWSVWHEGRDFEHYRDVNPRFCSEFGFQSYTSMDVIQTFAQGDDLNIASPVMESHQKNEGGNARIAETMFRYFRFPEGFENFVYLSQVQQGLAMKIAVDYWRSLRPHCMGALYWQLNDVWPVASWSSLDYGGGWKLLHHMARDFFAPLTVVAVPEAQHVRFCGLNDTADAENCSLKVIAVHVDGTARTLAETSVSLDADAATDIIKLDQSKVGADEVLVFEWSMADASGRDHVMLKPYKSLPLRNANVDSIIKQNGQCCELNLSADALALFVAVEADVPGRFSENAITILPGKPAMVTFTPNAPDRAPNFTIRDLYSSTHAQQRSEAA